MTEKEKLALLEETLDVEEGSLSPEMVLADIKAYDSLARLSIVVMMEDSFEKRITPDAIRSFKTFSSSLSAKQT